jgi:hypothetical protein
MPSVRRGLRCCHVPHGTERATHQERAPVSPRASRHRARHPPGKGFGVVTCPETPSPSPGRRGLWSRHVSHGFRPAPYAVRLWRRHVTEASGPPPGRAPVSSHVLWLQTRLLMREGSGAATCPVALGPRACPCIPKTPDFRLIMTSSGTRCRQRIKCVCDKPYAARGENGTRKFCTIPIPYTVFSFDGVIQKWDGIRDKTV